MSWINVLARSCGLTYFWSHISTGCVCEKWFVSSDHLPLCFDIAIVKTNICIPLPQCAAVVTMCQPLIGKI